jgi:hypothetical protein
MISPWMAPSSLSDLARGRSMLNAGHPSHSPLSGGQKELTAESVQASFEQYSAPTSRSLWRNRLAECPWILFFLPLGGGGSNLVITIVVHKGASSGV